MKVSELIVELQKLPQDAVVHIVATPFGTDGLDKDWNTEVRDVILNKDGTVDIDNWPNIEIMGKSL